MAGSAGGATAGRMSWLEPTKGVAMFMVVAYHVILYLQSAGVDAMLGRARAAFELFPMPAFFLITGMFAARQAQFSFPALWRRRLLPILYLYVFWSVARSLFTFFVPGMDLGFGEEAATPPEQLPLILVWPRGYWFLYALLLFTLLRWLTARLPVWVQVAGSAVVSTLFTTGLVDTQNIGWNRVGALFFFFVVGAVWSRQIRGLVARARLVHVLVAVVVFGAVTGMILLGLRWVPFLVLIGQVAVVAAGILVCTRLVGLRFLQVFDTLGVNSLKVYLLHLFVLAVLVAPLPLLEPETWPRWVAVILQVVYTVVTAVAALALGRLSSRVRWLYAPPAFLRPSARVARRSGGAAGDDRRGSADDRPAAAEDVGDAAYLDQPTEPVTSRKDLR